VIVGQRSYGKGLVQVTRPLSYNTQIKLTTAKYYIPSGRCIQARDFSHPNEDGSVGIIPDSLIKEFKTRNGRIVKDGGGIAPDVEILPETLSQISAELFLRNFIFDYATRYYWAHPDVKSPEQFIFSDQDFADFRKFLSERSFDYSTQTEESLKETISNAVKENYYEPNKEFFTKLEAELSHNLDKDLTRYRSEITELLEDEIIGRYFYEEGAIAWTLKNDEQLLKAVEILNNKGKYSSLLSGKTTPVIISKKEEKKKEVTTVMKNSYPEQVSV